MKARKPRFRVGQKVVLRGTLGKRAIIDRWIDEKNGMCFLDREVDGLRMWNTDDMRPLTSRERGPSPLRTKGGRR